ncbi:MAG: DoxX family protein [Blastopirellula sp. JB062]
MAARSLTTPEPSTLAVTKQEAQAARRGLSNRQYGLLVVCVLAQAATLLITWPLWQVRQTPVHMPVADLPQIPFGVCLLATLVLLLVRPRLGLVIHIATLALSFLFDQYRTQPQVIAIAALMLATVDDQGRILVRWFLASLWTWAGLHKLLSPDWFSFNAASMTASLGLEPVEYGAIFGWSVAIAELCIGMVAIFRPRWAAIPCVLMHVGIVLFLSPLAHNWNYSVMPWNLCTAIVGYWIMAGTTQVWPQTRGQQIAAVALMLYPLGFYVGWVDHGIASVLYSGNLPDGLITTHAGTEKIEGWGDLNVPFPNERRLLKAYFARSAPPGSKLHIADTRAMLDDLYFVKRADGKVRAISQEEFYAAQPESVAGVGLDDRNTMFHLSSQGAVMLKRDKDAPIYAVQIAPDAYRAEMLPLLAGLPNLEQINLAGCDVTDADLQAMPVLPNLLGVGVADTKISDAGLETLLRQPKLTYVESEGSRITPQGLERFQRLRPLQ